MFVSQPFYRARCDRSPCYGAPVTFVAQQRGDLVVILVDRQFSNACNERRGITDCVSSLLRQLNPQGLSFTALPTDVQSDDLRFRSFRHRDVAHQQAQNALAIA